MSNLLDNKLNTDQIKIIEENFKKVYSKLRYIYRQRNEFISHIVEAAQRYDPSRSNMSYVDYALRICLNRRNDYIRSEQRKRNKVVSIEHLLKSEKDSMHLATYNKNIDLIEWEDTKKNILNKMESVFKQNTENQKKNKSNETYKFLITEYILPMCEYGKDLTLADISKLTGYKMPTLWQMIHGEKMRSFIKSCL